MEMPLYAPPMLSRPGEVMSTPWSYQSLGVPLWSSGQVTLSSVNWVTANLAIFVPFRVPEAVTFTKLFWLLGSAVAGNIDAGIYDTAGVRLVSTGSTAVGSTSRPQAVDITDLTLARGTYYLALASDTAGATNKLIGVAPAAGILQALGLLQQAAAFPLATNANPATFAAYSTANVPMVGAQGYRALGPA